MVAPFELQTWHAGLSAFDNKLNNFSIGIDH